MSDNTERNENSAETTSNIAAATSPHVPTSKEEGIAPGEGDNQVPGSSPDDPPAVNGSSEIEGSSIPSGAGDDTFRMQETSVVDPGYPNENPNFEDNVIRDSFSLENLRILGNLARDKDFVNNWQAHDRSGSAASLSEITETSENTTGAPPNIAATSPNVPISEEEGIAPLNGNDQVPISPLDDPLVANGSSVIQGSSVPNGPGDDNFRMQETSVDCADENPRVEDNAEHDSFGNRGILGNLASGSDFDRSESAATLSGEDRYMHNRSPTNGSSADESEQRSELPERNISSRSISCYRREVIIRRANGIRILMPNGDTVAVYGRRANRVQMNVGGTHFEISRNVPPLERNEQSHIRISTESLSANDRSPVPESDGEYSIGDEDEEEEQWEEADEMEISEEADEVEVAEVQREPEEEQREGEQLQERVIIGETRRSSLPPGAAQRSEASIDPGELTDLPLCMVCRDSKHEILSSSRHFVSTECGHIFCCRCVRRIMYRNMRCPACRRSLNIRRIHRIFL